MPQGTPCEVHERGASGLAEYILAALVERGAEGIVVCQPCFGRARAHHEARMASVRAARDGRAWAWPAGTAVRVWPSRVRAGKFEGEPCLTRTRSESWRAGPLEVVLVEGDIGGVDVRRIERIEVQ